MIRQFYTVADDVCEELYVKKSQFICDIYPIFNEDEAKERINYTKKKYKDAKHYVFAYRLSNGVERYSDDGEPSGTAGVPILDILRGSNLFNVVIVVTRYFGGILLGTGGLVKAYSDVTKLAIEKMHVVEKHLAVEYDIDVNYNDYNLIQHFCSQNNYIIANSSFSDGVDLLIQMREEEEQCFLKNIEELLGKKVEIKHIRKYFYI